MNMRGSLPLLLISLQLFFLVEEKPGESLAYFFADILLENHTAGPGGRSGGLSEARSAERRPEQ